MNKLSLGSIAIILGGLLLSAELYGIKIIQMLDSQFGEWWPNEHIYEYIKQPPISVAITVTIAIIGYGVWLCYKGNIEDKNNK